MVDKPSVFEEMEILELEDFGSLFLLLRYFDILAKTHGKEEGKNGELQDCTLELHQYCLVIGDGAGGDGFLLLLLWVGILVGMELLL